MNDEITLQICVTCLGENNRKVGAEFYDAVKGRVDDKKITLEPVECFAVCKRPATVSVSQAGKWTYLIGDLNIREDIPALLDYIEAYGKSESGTPSLSKRPKVIRRGTIARLPAK